MELQLFPQDIQIYSDVRQIPPNLLVQHTLERVVELKNGKQVVKRVAHLPVALRYEVIQDGFKRPYKWFKALPANTKRSNHSKIHVEINDVTRDCVYWKVYDFYGFMDIDLSYLPLYPRVYFYPTAVRLYGHKQRSVKQRYGGYREHLFCTQ